MTSPQSTSTPPRWANAWLSVLPVGYILSPVALLGLPLLRSLPYAARALLLFYALSQIIPALATPSPLLALMLAALRTALMFGLMGVGHALRETHSFRLVLPGLGLVYLTAIVYSQLQGVDWLSGRLVHPYFTTTSLALTASFGVWLCLFLSGRWVWRAPGAVLALAILLASGSRGPLIATILGVLIGLLMGRNRRRWLGVTVAATAALMLGAALLGQRAEIATLERFRQLDLAGRQVIWQNALELIHDVPVGGVGSYRVGTALAPTTDCYLFASQSRSAECPAWVRMSGQPWLIAHNGVIHEWAEAGPLGTFGLLTLLGAGLFVTLRRRDPLGAATLSGVILTNVIDNTWLVPGALSGELLWVLVGTQLRHFSRGDLPGTSLTGIVLFSVLAVPLAAMTLPGRAQSPLSLQFLSAAPTFTSGAPYLLVAQFQGEAGQYKVSLNSCTQGCRAMFNGALTVTEQGGTLQIPDITLGADAQQRLELRLYADQPWALRPLATYHWTVRADSAASTEGE